MAKAYKDICPCKDCIIRTASCHGVCKEYKEWLKSGTEIEKRHYFEIKKKRKRK